MPDLFFFLWRKEPLPSFSAYHFEDTQHTAKAEYLAL